MNREELLERIRNIYERVVEMEKLLFEIYADLDDLNDYLYPIYMRFKIYYFDHFLEDFQNFVNDVKHTFRGRSD